MPRLSRAQVFAMAEALDADPDIEMVEVTETSDGKVRVSSVAMRPVTKPISMTKHIRDNGKSKKEKKDKGDKNDD